MKNLPGSYGSFSTEMLEGKQNHGSKERDGKTASLLQSDQLSADSTALNNHDMMGEATVLNEVINICKNLVGAGVLSLSGGVAIYSNSPRAVVSASIWILVLGVMFGYFCLVIAKVCKMTNSTTYRECWEKTMGERGGLAVSLVTALKPALGNLAYSSILSQTAASLFLTIGWRVSRVSCLLFITCFAILPLCLLKYLNVLAPFSVLGTTGILLTAAAMTWRYLDGSYSPGGKFYDDIPEQYSPTFGERNHAWSAEALPFVCMVFEAWVMHYNSPRFYVELKNATIPRFTLVVSQSFGLSGLIYICITGAGFLTFGGNADSYILNNYSPRDPLATLCRIAIAISTLLTFPIAFIGFRDGVLDVLRIPPDERSDSTVNKATYVLLTIITVTAIFVTDLGLINAVGGGTLATALVFVFPALMFRRAAQKCEDDSLANQQAFEIALVMTLMIVGVILGLIGVVEALRPH